MDKSDVKLVVATEEFVTLIDRRRMKRYQDDPAGVLTVRVDGMGGLREGRDRFVGITCWLIVCRNDTERLNRTNVSMFSKEARRAEQI